jgi:hypothetical protein
MDKVGSSKMESPDKLQEELIKGGKGMPFRWSRQESQGKCFGIDCQSVVRVRKRIQNTPRQWCQNVIAQVVGWEKPDPPIKW